MAERASAKRLVIYNHKGGVGKTIITSNLACALAQAGKKVLVVDTDPQTNLSAYFFEENVLDNFLDNSDKDSGQTIWSVLRPIVFGEGDFKKIHPVENRENLFIIPGDIRLSEYEVELNTYWTECLQRRMRGFKGTNAISRFVNYLCNSFDFDIVLYDSGPNIGALNRIILLDCDNFVIPAASDLFSRRALKTLGITLFKWIEEWNTILKIAPNDIYLLPGLPKLLGYIPQRFKMYGGMITDVSAKEIAQIEKSVYSEVVKVIRKVNSILASDSMRGYRLGEIKDFSTIVQIGQKDGLPIWEVAGGSPQQRYDAKRAFETLAKNVIRKMGL